jgi:2-polyprenyl-3-methyl-5-hydroxy-6-metoxy-1,4-benzoquinol methylase
VSLASEYKRQFVWRDWPTVFDALPSLHGQLVLDLGCAVGDLAGELVARGARVIGVDLNEELLQEARRSALFDTAPGTVVVIGQDNMRLCACLWGV